MFETNFSFYENLFSKFEKQISINFSENSFLKFHPGFNVDHVIGDGTQSTDEKQKIVVKNSKETVARLLSRPSILTSNGNIEPTQANSLQWNEELLNKSEIFANSIQATVRICVGGSIPNSVVGSGWFIKPGVIVTAGHVASALATCGTDGKLRINNSVKIERHGEFGNPSTQLFSVIDIWNSNCTDQASDIAIVQVQSTNDFPKEIELATNDIQDTSKIAVIGYPRLENENAIEMLAVRAIFDTTFGYKRFSPGFTTRINGDFFEHDASTLVGNSGSPIIDIKTGHAIGMHLGGTFLKSNKAVKFSQISKALKLSNF